MKRIDRIQSDLRRAIKERTGEECPLWLVPMVKTTAQQMAYIEKLESEINQSSLTIIEFGSQGQQKTTINPLLTMRKEEMRTLRLYLTDLGLNYTATPSKMTESTRKGVDDSDPLKTMFNTMESI